jgi:hypothetical protein
MTAPLCFEALQSILHQRIDQLPDHRKEGPNPQYRIRDAALGAFGIFFTQSPSFLDYQRTRQQTKGQNNAHTLLGVEQIPCDKQVRTLLEPSAPSHFDLVFGEGFERLAQHRRWAPFRVLGAHLLGAMEGTNSFSSKTIHGHTCLTRPLSHGQTLSYHSAMTPVIGCPGQAQVIALPPEYIMPQDGHAKQAGARAAGTRWSRQHAVHVAPHCVTLLGDELYSHQPFCALVWHHRFNCILTCKPDSHATLAKRLAFWQANDGSTEREGRHGHGRFTEVTRVRSINAVRLRGGDEALPVNWFEITVVNTTTGEQLYHNSCMTTHRLRDDNVMEVAQARRGRWKVANENNNGLKTRGYHLEHNLGHGQQSLSACMLSLNLLACLFHTVLEGSDAT